MALITSGNDLVELDDAELLARIGGKGVGLVRMLRQGLAVPPFVVVEVEAYRESGRFPPSKKPLLAEALAELGEGPVAVRSSAVAEDGAAHSFAGQLESFLGVDGVDPLARAVAACWRFARSERVLAYCAHNGIEPGPVAVVVQRQIDPDASGVLFTRDPQDPDRALISAAWGVGEGVVQGQVPCDSFHVDERGGIEASLEDKESATRLRGDRVVEEAVPEADRHRPCLSDGVLRRLARTGAELERVLGRPMDCEFAVEGNRIWWLQVRPITVEIPRGRKLLWDNSNIVESYSGVTTPLTYSFANHAYTIIYQLFCRVMGVDQATLRENEPMFHLMIGLIRGRVYYNLNAWYGVLTLLPAYQFNRSAMEQMMGVAEVASDEDAGEEAAAWQKALIHGPRVVKMLGVLGWRLFRLDADVRSFTATFEDAVARWRGKELSQMPAHQLLEVYSDLEQRLLWAWTPPIVNDFMVMVFYGLLRKQCQELTGDSDTELHNELLAGEGGLDSTAPTVEALRMADRIRKDPALVEVFASEDADRVVLERARAFSAFERDLQSWLDCFGDRTIDELKLETPGMRDDPSFLIASLRNYLRSETLDPDRFGEQEKVMRADAEQRAFGAVSGARELLFRWILRQARKRVRDRENLRFLRTRIFGLVRDLFRAFGMRLSESGALDTLEDIFYLTVEEIFGYVRGTAVTTDLRGLVALRRAEFAAYAEQPVPAERFHTRGMVHVANRFEGERRILRDADGRLAGTGCCPGVVEGVVRVLHDPREGVSLDGEILVAERTDPGWVPLYPTVSGLIIERGSLLSHSAVVAREMGLPTIVGLRGIASVLQDGDVVRMDGGTGVVEILSRADGSPVGEESEQPEHAESGQASA